MKVYRVRVPLASRPYDVYVGAGLLTRFPGLLARHIPGRRAVLVSDNRLLAGPAGKVVHALRRAGWKVDAKALPQGETAKSPAALQSLYSFLLRRGVERRTPLVAVGGGSIGDAAGFAAATYHRGIPLVHVPTTLLAQVDSAIGGKTAVNHPLAKNAVGAFYQPLFVAADTGTLRTLPQRELLSGLAEAAKYALVFDPALARRLLARWDTLLARDPAELARLVRACAAWKAQVVAGDERDLSGRRELLNFGHTLGHALETAGGYRRFRHGEAVAWGMRFAVELSAARGWLGRSRALADALLARLPARSWGGLQPGRVLRLLARDKKVRSGRNVFILLRELGRPVRVADVGAIELRAALRRLDP